MGQGPSSCASSGYHMPKQIGSSCGGGDGAGNSSGRITGGKRHWRGGGVEADGEEDLDLTLGLPDECLAWVFGKLGSHDRNACSLVCRRWKIVDSKSRQRLVLLAGSDLTPILPHLLFRFNSVSVLSLKCSRKLISIDDDALSRIPSLLTSLKKLKLKGCVDISDDGLHAFSMRRPPLLTKLSFASCTFGARGLNSLLSNCPSLQDLTLKRLRKLDAQSTPLSIIDVVVDINDNGNTNNNHTEEGKKSHTHHHKLERLCLKDLHNARLFAPLLCSSVALKTLIVCRSSGNWDRVLESLRQGGGGGNLTEIQMENVQLGDAGLIAISSACPDLEVLYLSRASDCTDAGFSAVANSCRKLRKIYVDACSKFGTRTVGDDGIMSLATSCSQLQEVVLMGVPVSVLSLNALASNCPALERMALCNTDSVRDPELGFVAAKFSSLKKLCIKNCPISNAGVKAIGAGCPNLVKLKVKRCRAVTLESVFHLNLQRRSLVVSVDAGSLSFEGEEVVAAEDEVATIVVAGRSGGAGGFRRGAASATATATNSRMTDVVCSSRGASLLRSKLGAALQLRRPSSGVPSTSSAHAVARARR